MLAIYVAQLQRDGVKGLMPDITKWPAQLLDAWLVIDGAKIDRHNAQVKHQEEQAKARQRS